MMATTRLHHRESASAARGIFIACLCASLALASCASRSAAGSTGPVLIGLYADLSSTEARDGNDAMKGAQLRVDDINSRGGVMNGRMALLVTRDMKQSPTEAVKAFTALAQENGVCAVIGSTIPSAGIAVSPVAELVKVPLVSLATDDRVTTPELKPADLDAAGPVRRYAFLAQPSAAQLGALVGAFASRNLFLHRFATVCDPATPSSVLQARAFERAIRAAGKVLAASEALPEPDPSTPVKAVMDAQADAVFVCCSAEKNAAVARKAKEMGYHPVLLGNQAWYAPLLDTAGDAASSAWFGMSYSPDDPGMEDLRGWLMSRYGETPRPAMVPGWEAVGMVVAAVRKAGSTNPQKVRDSLEQMKGYKGFTAAVDMDRKTHRLAAPTIAIMRILSGAYVTENAHYNGK
jgi:branched-chain amino acid transport system substrate-binding protein